MVYREGQIKQYPIEFVQKMCIATYRGEIKDRKIFRWIPFINSFGGTAVRLVGWSSIILGLIIACGSFYLEQINWSLVFIVLVTGVLLYMRGFSLIYNVAYVNATRCKKCARNYAYEEREEPDVKEVSTEDSYEVTITRYWRCKYCGYRDISEGPENVKSRKGTKYRPVKIKCEKCGKTELCEECRDPDVKEEILGMTKAIVTTKYYECKYCGKLNITEEQTESESSIFD